MVVATAPGKVILVGEHAVVYGRPAIAAPVWETLASAVIDEAVAGSGCTIDAPDVHLRLRLVDAAADEPLALVTRLTLARLNLPSDPDWRISVTSQIPIASGLGSGAALSAALVRAIYRQAGCAPNVAVVSELVYASEKRYHGTPSGIDNTVVAYGKPVWFVIGSPPQVFTPGRAFRLAIADTGIPSPTKETVAAVRRRRHAPPHPNMKPGLTRSPALSWPRAGPWNKVSSMRWGRCLTKTRRYWRKLGSVQSRWIDW